MLGRGDEVLRAINKLEFDRRRGEAVPLPLRRSWLDRNALLVRLNIGVSIPLLFVLLLLLLLLPVIIKLFVLPLLSNSVIMILPVEGIFRTTE